MRHFELFLAAAMLLAGSVSMLRAESLMALNSADYSTPAVSSWSIAVPSGVAPASSAVALSPVEIAASDEAKDRSQEMQADLNQSASHLGVLPGRLAGHRARVRSSCAHLYRSTRVAKRPVQARLAALRAQPWRVAPSEAQCSDCWSVVILGVGY